MKLFGNDGTLSALTLVTSELLTSLGVAVTKTSIQETLKNHPDYPSLLSISDSLCTWGITNKCYQVNDDKLLQLPLPFITNLETSENRFVTVTEISSSNVTYADAYKKNKTTVSINEFIKSWNNIALVAESVNLKEERDYMQKRNSERARVLTIPFVLASVLLWLFFFIFSLPWLQTVYSIEISSLALLLFLGCIVTSLLLFYEIDKSNYFIRQICSSAGKTNCSAVLESPGAKIFNWLSWSEIGFFYFAGSFLFLLISNGQSTALFLLACLNAAALPYCLFSVYYQWKVVKQWCPLCLAVQALLAAEFIFLYFLVWNNTDAVGVNLSAHLLLLCFAGYLIPTLFWSFSKSYMLHAKAGEKYKHELNLLKYNQSFFETLLIQQKRAKKQL